MASEGGSTSGSSHSQSSSDLIVNSFKEIQKAFEVPRNQNLRTHTNTHTSNKCTTMKYDIKHGILSKNYNKKPEKEDDHDHDHDLQSVLIIPSQKANPGYINNSSSESTLNERDISRRTPQTTHS